MTGHEKWGAMAPLTPRVRRPCAHTMHVRICMKLPNHYHVVRFEGGCVARNTGDILRTVDFDFKGIGKRLDYEKLCSYQIPFLQIKVQYL